MTADDRMIMDFQAKPNPLTLDDDVFPSPNIDQMRLFIG
jgi:hypothetical protein